MPLGSGALHLAALMRGWGLRGLLRHAIMGEGVLQSLDCFDCVIQ